MVNRLYRHTYSKRVIWAGVGILVFVGMTIALLLDGRWEQNASLIDQRVSATADMQLESRKPSGPLLDRVAAEAAQLHNHSRAHFDVIWDHKAVTVVSDFDRYCMLLLATGGGLEPPPELVSEASQEPPPLWSNRALAAFHVERSQFKRAIQALQREWHVHPEQDESRLRLLAIVRATKDRDELARLSQDSKFNDIIEPFDRLVVAINQTDLQGIARWIVPSQVASYRPIYLGLALLGGLVWLVFLYQIGAVVKQGLRTFVLLLSGFTLGMISTWLTVIAIIFTQEVLGISEGQSDLSITLYMILGVGLREELIKLLCFVPLIPFLLKHNRPLEWLTVASAVGLGFAIEENTGYYAASGGGALSGRYLTANILHIALTGLAGLAVCQAIKWPQHYLQHAGSTLILVIIFHGLYDAFLSAPALRPYYLAAFIILGGIVYYYFMAIHSLRGGDNSPISLTAVFCWGFVLLVMSCMATISAVSSFSVAFDRVLPDLFFTGLLLYLVVRCIDDRLSV